MQKSFQSLSIALLTVVALVAPVVASAASVSIAALSGTSVNPKSAVTFTVVPSGFSSPVYQLSDSFPGSSVTVSSNMDAGGHFAWVPLATDVGTHTFTITVNDSTGATATVTQTIVVNPMPTVSIQSVSTNGNLPIGKALTFLVTQSGFTNPTYIVSDSFSGSSVGTSNLSNGLFSWVPDYSQNGDHTITVYVTDQTGRSATASQFVRVGSGPTLYMQQVSPLSKTLKLGETATFSVTPVNFQPTSYSIVDAFPGSTVSNASINSNGQFSWMPSGKDVGTHVLTVRGIVGAFGDSATTSITFVVQDTNGQVPASQAVTPVQATSSTQLSDLQSQLAALMAKMQTQSGSNAVSTSAELFTSNMKPGSRSDEVLRLQKLLVKLGLLTNTPNGYYGVGTTAAIKKFQSDRGLDPLGSVGPATRAALNALLDDSKQLPASSNAGACAYTFSHFMGYGDDDTEEVTQLQTCLIKLGYLSGEVTGFYGRSTETAVKKFQIAKGMEGLGYVNSATRTLLNK